MNPRHFLVIFVISFPSSYADCNVSDCSLLKELECALYTTDSNEKRLNQAFFPPRKATSRYIKVDYVFNTTGVVGIDRDSCNVTYIWSIGGFLLIQPPSIFQLTSLMFSYPTNNIDNIALFFPSPCHQLIHVTDKQCSCAGMENGTLDILTQQLLQYSKFSNPDRIVRDVTSVAQALCVEDIEKGYFNHADVTWYIVAKLVLPVIATVVSLTLLYNYYPKLTVRVTNPNDRPTFVGVLMAGIYLSLYIIAVDIAAIVFYVANKTDYNIYPKIARSRSLQLVYYSFISECALSTLALLVAASFHENKRRPVCLRKSSRFIIILFISFVVILSLLLGIVIHYPNSYSIVVYSSLWLGVLIVTIAFMLAYWTTPTDFFLICFITVPVILGSTHIDYILVAWLTEPAKTTSVSILAIGITFYLFLLSRFLYKFVPKLATALKKLYQKINGIKKERSIMLENCLSPYCEGLKLVITFVLGLVGVGFVSLQIAAFYLLPFPSIRLVDYLDNIFQISLVIFGGLITYKVISNQESDVTKFLTMFNSKHESSSKISNVVDSEPVEIKAELTAVVKNRVRINAKPEIEFGEKVLVVSIPQLQGEKETKIPIKSAGFNLRDKWSHQNNLWQLSLESSEIDFYLFQSSGKSHKFTACLKDSKFMVKNSAGLTESGLASNLELLVINNQRQESFLKVIKKSAFQNSCDLISPENNAAFFLQVPLQCYYVKKAILGTDEGATCFFNNSMSVTVVNNHVNSYKDKIERYLLPCVAESPLTISTGNISSFTLQDREFQFHGDNELTVMRHSTFASLKFSLNIKTGSWVGIKMDTNNQTKKIILDWNKHTVEIPLDYLQQDTFMLALNIGQAIGMANPQLDFRSNLQSIAMILSPNHVYSIIFVTRNDEVFMNFLGEQMEFKIIEDFQFMKIMNVQTASFTVTNPVPIEFELKHQEKLVNVTWKDSKKKMSKIKYFVSQDDKFTFEVNHCTVDFPLLFFPLHKNKWKLQNEVETAAITCRKLAQSLVERYH